MAEQIKELDKETLWQMADKLRGNMDAAEYKHIVLGLIFLKYISDSFEDAKAEIAKDEYADAEDRDEYTAKGVFWLPKEARWEYISANAKGDIGKIIDDAMYAIERDNYSLKNVLPKNYNRSSLDKIRLGGVVDLLTNRTVYSKDKDILGGVYEYFLEKFASAEGKLGGEFYTPRSVVQLLVEMLEPYNGRVYDPCCGSGGMFVQSEEFVKEHSGKIGDLAIYGQESNATTWRLAKMNLAIRKIDADLGTGQADTFHNDIHKGKRFDYILANPPFNISDWGAERLQDDDRFREYGMPPAGNANYAWILHMLSHLSPRGTAGFVLANGSMSTSSQAELSIRKNLIEKNNVECIITMPAGLFMTTPIPVCLWFITKNKAEYKNHVRNYRNREGEVLFIDARNIEVEPISRTQNKITKASIQKIAKTFHNWRNLNPDEKYEDIAGFCKAVKNDVIAQNDYILTPGRYVGIEAKEEDQIPFEERMATLTTELKGLFQESHSLENTIKEKLKSIGFEI